MVVELELYRHETDAFLFDRNLIDQVAFPLGDRYPIEIMTNYFSHYGGMVKKFKPRRLLEIGVRYGYTGIVFWAAANEASVKNFEYLGIDDESYHAKSCNQANDNFRIVGANEQCRCLRWNSFDGIPSRFGTFDMIHIDGNHESHGVLNDLGHCWPILNVGGFILLDDYYFPEIKAAIHQWLEGYRDADEVIAVQFVENERGHCYLAKTGLSSLDSDWEPRLREIVNAA